MNNKKKKSGGSKAGGIIALIMVMIASLAENFNGDAVAQLIILLVPVAIIVAVVVLIRKAIKKAKAEKSTVKGGFKRSHSFNYTAKKEKDLEDSPFTATRMDRNVSYNDHAAEDNFLRDKERRLSQLDVFLKNGIIEKDEYRLLKERYQKQG